MHTSDRLENEPCNAKTTTATLQEHSKSANLRQRQSFNRKWGIQIRIFGLIRIQIRMSIRMSVGSVPKCGCIILSVSVLLASMSNRPLTVWEKLTNVKKSPIPQWWRKYPHADPDHHQKLITSRGSPLAHVCQVWSTSVSAFVSYPVYRMTDRTIT